MNTVSMDFGTYNSAVAYRLPNNEVTLLRPPGTHTPSIPSFITFSSDGQFDCFGQAAKNAADVDPGRILWGVKRLLGLSYKDAFEHGELERFRKDLVVDEGGKLIFRIGACRYTPIQLVALFLRKVKETLESPAANLPLGGPLEKLIVTHPAYFDCQQTASLKDAALEAGYKAVELMTEPEAAAIAYKDLIDFNEEPLVMVIDWGAGTLDFFIAHFFLENGRPKIAQATPAFGDTRLGGIDMDNALLRRVKDVHRLQGLAWDDEARLRIEVEKSKIALSNTHFTARIFAAGGTQLALNFIRSREAIPAGQDSTQWVCLEETLKDREYGGILEKFKENLRFTLKKHNLTTRDIEQLILVGGPMCMPVVRAAVAEVFADNRTVTEQLARFEAGFPISPFEAVVKGAILNEEVDVGAFRSPYTYGFMIEGKLVEQLLIERGTPIAHGASKVSREMPPLSVKAGNLLNISLYMGVEKAGGAEHWRLGDYRFAPVAAAGRGTSIQTSIELTAEGICSLKVRDQVSGNPLNLPFKDDTRQQIGKPEVLQIPGQKELETLRKTAPDVYDALMKSMQGGDFSAADVDRTRKDALTYQGAVRQAINERRQVPPEAIGRYQKLTELLPKVTPGRAIKADSVDAKVFQEMLNNLMELIKILRNAGFQF